MKIYFSFIKVENSISGHENNILFPHEMQKKKQKEVGQKRKRQIGQDKKKKRENFQDLGFVIGTCPKMQNVAVSFIERSFFFLLLSPLSIFF